LYPMLQAWRQGIETLNDKQAEHPLHKQYRVGRQLH
jgi:hypothetical protein